MADVATRSLTRRLARVGIILAIVAVVAGAGLLLTLNALHVSFFSVTGSSMEPTLMHRDSIILRQSEELKNDDLVFFYLPKAWTYDADADLYADRDPIVVKRIIAVPGDEIAYDGSAFTVNGEEVYSFTDNNYDCDREPGYTHEVEEGEIVAFGDNAKVSLDSRRVFCDGKKDFFVPENLIIDHGTVAFQF